MGGIHVCRDRDFLYYFPKFHELGRAGGWMGLHLPALGPFIGIVVVADVTQGHSVAGAVDDNPDVEVYTDRPEVGVFCAGDAMQAMARLGGIKLQVKGGGLGDLLLLVGEAGQARCKCVGYAELHEFFGYGLVSLTNRLPILPSGFYFEQPFLDTGQSLMQRDRLSVVKVLV